MDFSHQAQTSHYAAPPTYYPSSTASDVAIIGARPNPIANFDQVQVEVPISVQPGLDACLTSPLDYTVSQCQAATYASYQASMSGAAGGVDLAAAYLGSMPTVGPIHPVRSLSLSHTHNLSL